MAADFNKSLDWIGHTLEFEATDCEHLLTGQMSGQTLNSHVFSLFYFHVTAWRSSLLTSFYQAPLHCRYVNGWSAIYWSMSSLLGTASLRKINSPLPEATQLPITPPLRGRATFSILGFCLVDHVKVLCMLSSHICLVFRNHFSTIVIMASGSKNLLPPPSWFLSLGRTGVPSFIFSTLNSYPSLFIAEKWENLRREDRKKVGARRWCAALWKWTANEAMRLQQLWLPAVGPQMPG